MKPIFKNRKGATALMVVMIIGTAVLLMAVGASRLGLGELEMGYISQKSDETLYLADGCVEEVLQHLRIDASYSGGTLSLDSGSCIIDVVTDGSNRTISVTATIGEFNKKIQVGATLNGSTVTVNSWNEVVL